MNSFVPSLMVTGVLCFGLGYAVAQFSTEEIRTNPAEVSSPSNRDKVSESELDQLLNNGSNQSSSALFIPSPNQISKLNSLISEASPEKVEHYLKQAFPNADLSVIGDKKKFAQRATEEFAQTKNDEQKDLSGQVVVAVEEKLAGNAQVLQNIYKSQYLFAHLDTFNKVENAQQVFIRWINRDTGEVLFFSPQKIIPNTSQNWVSFTPAQGWKAGTYDVRYYQMKDDLKPIAQTSYVIQSVVE